MQNQGTARMASAFSLCALALHLPRSQVLLPPRASVVVSGPAVPLRLLSPRKGAPNTLLGVPWSVPSLERLPSTWERTPSMQCCMVCLDPGISLQACVS